MGDLTFLNSHYYFSRPPPRATLGRARLGVPGHWRNVGTTAAF
jgi:hypothetical protein